MTAAKRPKWLFVDGRYHACSPREALDILVEKLRSDEPDGVLRWKDALEIHEDALRESISWLRKAPAELQTQLNGTSTVVDHYFDAVLRAILSAYALGQRDPGLRKLRTTTASDGRNAKSKKWKKRAGQLALPLMKRHPRWSAANIAAEIFKKLEGTCHTTYSFSLTR